MKSLEWKFDGSGEWESASAMNDDGVPFIYRIQVCDDGTFSVADTDSELKYDPENWAKTFDSLEMAKKACGIREIVGVAQPGRAVGPSR